MQAKVDRGTARENVITDAKQFRNIAATADPIDALDFRRGDRQPWDRGGTLCTIGSILRRSTRGLFRFRFPEHWRWLARAVE